MTVNAHLLHAAAAFIRGLKGGTESETILRDLMAQACDDAAGPNGILKLNPSTLYGKLSPGKSAPPKYQLPLPAVDGITEENARLLLKAGGLKRVAGTTLRLYMHLLRGQKRSWAPREVCKALDRPSRPIKQALITLCRRGILKRVEKGRYQA